LRIIASKLIGPKNRETYPREGPSPNGKSACLPNCELQKEFSREWGKICVNIDS
jgi:hypothetical protein